jgi:hypothetical protein
LLPLTPQQKNNFRHTATAAFFSFSISLRRISSGFEFYISMITLRFATILLLTFAAILAATVSAQTDPTGTGINGMQQTPQKKNYAKISLAAYQHHHTFLSH